MSGSGGAVRRDRHPYRLYGVIALVAIAGLIAVCIASFQQDFTPAAYVTVHISRAGDQLLPGSDVKVRGIDIGTVDTITSDGSGADLKLRMKPSSLKTLPTNVTVQLMPKTLFGEKYVSLQLPARPSSTYLHDGSVIAEDQSTPALEIDQALDDLLPVLKAVEPQQLDMTLTALSTALQGRGPELGQTIRQLDTYLKGINPQLPTLKQDMTALSTTTRTYDEAAGPLLQMLGNLTVTSNTVVDEQHQLSALLADVTGSATTLRQFLAANEQNLVRVNTVNRKVITLLARYSPEIPCFIRGDAGLVPRIHDAVPTTPGLNHAAHVQIEFVPAFPVYENPKDLPEFKDTRGPHCYGLPHPALSLPVIHYKDGTQDDPRFDKQGQPGPLGGSPNARDSSFSASSMGGSSSPSMGSAGTAEERAAFNTLLGPALGTRASKVPDVADLLWGPLARGGTVSVS